VGVVVGGWDGAGADVGTGAGSAVVGTGAGAEVGPAVEGKAVGAGEGLAGHQNGVAKVPSKHVDRL
jgi:hypothetical protein